MVQHYKIDNQIYEVPDDATLENVQDHLSNSNNVSLPKTFAEKYQDFWNDQKANPNDSNVVETIFGRMNKDQPEFKPGSPENKELLDTLISKAGVASPGFNAVGDKLASEPVKSLLSTVGGHLKNTFVNAFKNVEPYKAAAEQAGQEAEQATTAATIPKPGLYENPMTELENVEHDIGKHINAEADHGVRAGKEIRNRVNDIQKYWGDSYKKFEDKIKDVKFQMPSNILNNMGFDEDAIKELVRQKVDPKKIPAMLMKKSSEEKNPFYEHLISKAPTAEDTNAKDFLIKYRDFRDALGGLKDDIRSGNYGSIEKSKINDAIQKAQPLDNQIKDTLTTGLGEHKPEFDWLMKGYSEQVFPLRRNPIYKAAKINKMSPNIMNDLRTDESGMDVMRGIVKQDPELLRNVVGQRYIANPSEIHAPDEQMREYLDEMPEFKNLLQKREDILQDAVSRKDVSLKNKMQAEKKLREIKTAKSKAKTRLWMGGIGTGSAVGIPYGYGKISKMLGD